MDHAVSIPFRASVFFGRIKASQTCHIFSLLCRPLDHHSFMRIMHAVVLSFFSVTVLWTLNVAGQTTDAICLPFYDWVSLFLIPFDDI
jgi:hypothetical protein